MMEKNVIEQVKEIEAEADDILAEARRKAQELEESTKAELASLRQEHEKRLAHEVESFKAKSEQQTEAGRAGIHGRASQIAARLKSLKPEAVSSAIELILKRLCEG